jgi:hypothetical protein
MEVVTKSEQHVFDPVIFASLAPLSYSSALICSARCDWEHAAGVPLVITLGSASE